MSNYNSLELAIEAAKAKSKELDEDLWGFVEFDGQNCNDEDNCLGWDGNSRRCSCGNRKVSWSFQEYPTGLWGYYAVAW